MNITIDKTTMIDAVKNIANLGAQNIKWGRSTSDEGLRKHYNARAFAYILSAKHVARMLKHAERS